MRLLKSPRKPQRNQRRRGQRGQAMVEFSLVILVFVTIFTGIIEFGLAFSTKMEVNFASRDGAIAASESGSTPSSADGAILNRIDNDTSALASRARIDHVDIFWANPDGTVHGGAIERYTPGGPLYTGWGGWTNTVDLYKASDRCAFIGGTPAGCVAGKTGPDTIGVTIVYNYSWATPLPKLIALGGTGMTFTETNLATMEPIPGTGVG